MFCFGLSSLCILQTYLGVIGLAWVGTMCKTSWAGYNAGVNEKRENVLATSEVGFTRLKITIPKSQTTLISNYME